MNSMKSFFRALFFLDGSILVRRGKQKILFAEDLLPLPPVLDPQRNPLKQEPVRWETGRALIWSLMKGCRRGLGKSYSAYGFAVLMGLMQPVLVNRFVGAISKGVGDPAVFRFALVCAFLLGITAIFRGVAFQHFFSQALKQYQIIVNLLNEKLFRHSLKMSQRARAKIPVGDVVNHMGSDSEVVADFSMVFADLIFMTVTISSVIGMLFHYIGLSAVLPLVLLAILAPATRFLAKRFTHLDEVMMKERDHRVTLMGQILNSIRVVKYFAWEKSVAREIREVRVRELGARRRMARAESFAGVSFVAVSSIVLFVALGVHAYRGFALDPALVFTLVSLFGLLEEPFGSLSWQISRTTNSFVSAERIARFLRSETLEEEKSLPPSGERAVSIRADGLPAFRKKSWRVESGQSVALVGPVGGGKSTLLMALLGEDPESRLKTVFLDSAGREVQARQAYVPQEAYIVNGSLRDNLVFGDSNQGIDELNRAISLADLAKDLALFPAGLQTEIGEKGVNLSGGQKQRVSLARAVLQRPQVVFLDDPLSAVDHETERNLIQNLVFGEWSGITRIVATHRLEHLRRFDRILFIEGGVVVADGSFEEVHAAVPRFRTFIAEHGSSQGSSPSAEEKAPGSEAKAHSLQENQGDSQERITEDEDREVGAVKGSVYWDYFKSLGGEGPWRNWRLVTLMGGALLVMALPLLQRWWLGAMSSYQQDGNARGFAAWIVGKGGAEFLGNTSWAIAVYGGIGLSALLFNLLNSLWWLERGIGAGKLMHENMLSSLLKTPLRFFDATPVGRILQRFSRDVESVDIYLQRSFMEAIHILIEVILCLVLILVLVPASFVFIAPILVIYYRIQRNYRIPAREVKRLDSIARSPRYAHFKETLVGLPVIRGFHSEAWFLESFHQKLAHSQRMFFNHVILNRWFSVRVPLVGGLIAMTTSIGIVWGARSGHLTAGTAGVLTIYMLSFWAYLNWGIRIFADIESRMTSVERMKYYANLPPEVDLRLARRSELAPTWPARGEIVFEEVQARYAAHLPRVLHGVSFRVEAGSKVGLIGRTGSGKSTIFQCLFRFVEPEGGRILIDGEDIAGVPLERLRKSLAIIPQDPTLFLGTIRSNLDPYGEYPEEELREALRNASLWEFVKAIPEGVNAPVLESGLNLSQGQRQLLCLARALLTKAKIIVLDEATASVDVETDAVLQKVIREKLGHATLLIIAHRLGTVGDCDKVVELAFGRVEAEMRPEEARRALAEIVQTEEA